jgi:hypothetical protein
MTAEPLFATRAVDGRGNAKRGSFSRAQDNKRRSAHGFSTKYKSVGKQF